MTPYVAAVRAMVDDVIDPGETRIALISSLDMLRSKRAISPNRKHGNMPLREAMIEITKGNPTPEEIAARVAVLTLAGRTTQPRLASPRAGKWRRSTSFAESNPVEPNRRDRRWRTWTTGWSCVGPAHAPLPHRAAQRRDPNVADPGQVGPLALMPSFPFVHDHSITIATRSRRC